MKPQPDPTGVEMAAGISPATLKALYTTMLRIRRVEEKIAELLCSKLEIVCPIHLYTGQEAVAAGVCASLRRDDYVFSTHRSHGHYIAKGGDVKALIAELYGKATGCSRGRGGSMHLASDGAANEGAFYESLNFASLKKLPIIFVCENNAYSTHMPVAACLADTNIYQKAEAFDMPGIRVDGNNVLEVFNTAGKAIENARRGRGPALIECMTYRWRGHVGPNFDLDKGLRTKKELDYWMNRCPIKVLEGFLSGHDVLSESEKAQICEDIDKEITEAIAFAKESPYPDEGELLDNVFKD